MRRLLRLPLWTIRAAVIGLLVLGGAFLLLTRTEVGRDQLRVQTERAFADALQGEIRIGKLSGNLIGTTYARDVEIFDPEGRLVLRSDSVVVRPTWRALLTQRVEVAEATLIRPTVSLTYADGRWNLADAFRSRRPSTPDADPLGLRLAEVTIVGGTVTTRRIGPAPEVVVAGTLFDFTDAVLTGLYADLSLDLAGDARALSVGALRARLPAQGLTVRHLSGELDFADGLRVAGVDLETEGTRLSGSFALGRATTPAERALTLALDAPRLDFDEWSRLVPALPFRRQVSLNADVTGRLGALQVERLDVAHGRSHVAASGTVTGLPERATVGLDLAPSEADPLDMAAVWPAMPLPLGTADLGLLALDGSATGTFPLRQREPLRVDGRATLRGRDGRVAGTFGIRQNPGGRLGVRLDATATALDPGALLAVDALDGRATGRVQLATPAAPGPRDSSRVAVPDAGFALRLALTDVEVPGRSADALAADVLVVDGGVEGTARVLQGASAISATGRFRFREGLFAEGEARLDAFDVSRLVPRAPATRLTGRLSIDAGGPSLAAWTGTASLDLDAAAVSTGGADSLRLLPLDRLALAVAPIGQSPRLDLRSNLADVRLDTPLPLDTFVPLAAQWGADFAEAGRRAWARPAPGDTLRLAPRGGSGPTWENSIEPGPVALRVQIHQPTALAATLPGFTDLGETTATVRGTIGSQQIDVQIEADAGGGLVRAVALSDPAVRGAIRADRSSDLLETTRLSADLRAREVRLWPGRDDPPRVERPSVRIRYADRQAALQVRTADSDAGTGADSTLSPPIALQLAAAFDVLADRNRLRVDTLWADAPELRLALAQPASADLVGGRVELGRAAFERRGTTGPTQRLTLSGTLSPAPSDSLVVQAEALELSEVLGALNIRTPLGGRLDGRAAISGVLAKPEVGGRVVLDPLLFDGRPAGQAVLESQILGGEAGLGVDLRVVPLPQPMVLLPGAAQNDLRITGEMRLPARRPDGSRDPGRLALNIDADRLDLFFFDWLFPSILSNARGAASGTGRIQGTFSYPVFLAGLDVSNGRFDVPAFGLTLGAEGRVEVDGDGIHVREAVLDDGAGGRGSVAGSVLFNRYRYFSLDLDGRLDRMQVIDVPASDDLPFYGDIRASGDLALSGPLDNTFLRSENAVTTPDSRIFIPVTASGPAQDEAFLVFADSVGQRPEQEQRRNLISSRPKGERAFLDGLGMLLNISAPPGSTVHLVFDPVTGEEIVAQGEARIQLGITDGRFATYGRFEVGQGAYAFTAGDVFTRTFELEPGGTLVWTGDPIDARMDLAATYRTRASLAGLGLPEAQERQRVPVVVRADVGGRVTAPLVQLSLAVDRQSEGGTAGGAAAEALRTRLNETDRRAEYATSVLLTNTFLLAPSDDFGSVGDVADELFYTSLGALVSSRVGGFVNRALGNDQVEVLLGVQPGTNPEELDVTYGLALRFLDERLVLRGEGLYQRDASGQTADPLQGEVAAELRLSDEVSIEVFARREGDPLVGEGVAADPYGTVGAGVTYRSEFASWRRFFQRLFGGREEQAAAEAVRAPLAAPSEAD